MTRWALKVHSILFQSRRNSKSEKKEKEGRRKEAGIGWIGPTKTSAH